MGLMPRLVCKSFSSRGTHYIHQHPSHRPRGHRTRLVAKPNLPSKPQPDCKRTQHARLPEKSMAHPMWIIPMAGARALAHAHAHAHAQRPVLQLWPPLHCTGCYRPFPNGTWPYWEVTHKNNLGRRPPLIAAMFSPGPPPERRIHLTRCHSKTTLINSLA